VAAVPGAGGQVWPVQLSQPLTMSCGWPGRAQISFSDMSYRVVFGGTMLGWSTAPEERNVSAQIWSSRLGSVPQALPNVKSSTMISCSWPGCPSQVRRSLSVPAIGFLEMAMPWKLK
jgi:hypothetical protein